jgi:hypothetical protein
LDASGAQHYLLQLEDFATELGLGWADYYLAAFALRVSGLGELVPSGAGNPHWSMPSSAVVFSKESTNSFLRRLCEGK